MIALTDGGVEDDSFSGWHCRRWLRRVALKMIASADFGIGDSFSSFIDDIFRLQRVSMIASADGIVKDSFGVRLRQR